MAIVNLGWAPEPQRSGLSLVSSGLESGLKTGASIADIRSKKRYYDLVEREQDIKVKKEEIAATEKIRAQLSARKLGLNLGGGTGGDMMWEQAPTIQEALKQIQKNFPQSVTKGEGGLLSLVPDSDVSVFASAMSDLKQRILAQANTPLPGETSPRGFENLTPFEMQQAAVLKLLPPDELTEYYESQRKGDEDIEKLPLPQKLLKLQQELTQMKHIKRTGALPPEEGPPAGQPRQQGLLSRLLSGGRAGGIRRALGGQAAQATPQAGGEGQVTVFNSAKEADKSGLPKGTIVLIRGKGRYQI